MWVRLKLLQITSSMIPFREWVEFSNQPADLLFNKKIDHINMMLNPLFMEGLYRVGMVSVQQVIKFSEILKKL